VSLFSSSSEVRFSDADPKPVTRPLKPCRGVRTNPTFEEMESMTRSLHDFLLHDVGTGDGIVQGGPATPSTSCAQLPSGVCAPKRDSCTT